MMGPMQKNSIDAPSPGPQPSGTAPERLDSWKEIAAYLNRDVRTVQRWERREGMPVHRHQHDKRGSVYALTSEVDAWRKSRRLELLEDAQQSPAESDRPTAAPAMWRWFVLSSGVAVLALLTIAYFMTRHRAEATHSPKIESLAVLPFQNLSGDPSQDYFADGMTEELIGRLSRITGLRVISRTSSMYFKNTQLSVPEIARRLGVDAIVEGSLVREGRQVRLHTQLIRAATDDDNGR